MFFKVLFGLIGGATSLYIIHTVSPCLVGAEGILIAGSLGMVFASFGATIGSCLDD